MKNIRFTLVCTFIISAIHISFTQTRYYTDHDLKVSILEVEEWSTVDKKWNKVKTFYPEKEYRLQLYFENRNPVVTDPESLSEVMDHIDLGAFFSFITNQYMVDVYKFVKEGLVFNGQINEINVYLEIAPAIWVHSNAKVKEYNSYLKNKNQAISPQKAIKIFTRKFKYIGLKELVKNVPINIRTDHVTFANKRGPATNIYPRGI